MNNNADHIHDLLSKMTDEDESRYIFAMEAKDHSTIREIAKKYGYFYSYPLSKLMSDDEICYFTNTRTLGDVQKIIKKFSLPDDSGIQLEKVKVNGTVEELFERIRTLDGNMDELKNIDALLSTTLDETTTTMLKAAAMLQLAGCYNIVHKLGVAISQRALELYFTPAISALHEKEGVSKANSIKASKPRHPLYQEVMGVLEATWKKYPRASKTGLLEALTHHYYKKATRNAIDGWIKNSGLIPPKPEKYSDFELVFPSLTS
jgi:hypothetical protein